MTDQDRTDLCLQETNSIYIDNNQEYKFNDGIFSFTKFFWGYNKGIWIKLQ